MSNIITAQPHSSLYKDEHKKRKPLGFLNINAYFSLQFLPILQISLFHLMPEDTGDATQAVHRLLSFPPC